MTSGLDGLGAAALPNLTTLPSVANAPALSSSNAKRGTGTDSGVGGRFDHLLRLQDRGRKLETELQSRGTGVSSADAAATARAQQAAFYAKELKEIRELVGPAPSGNARRALAAIVTRLEGGGELKPTDKARIRLAIAADERRVDLAGANAYRHAILELDKGYAMTDEAVKDPSMLQDEKRLAQFQQLNKDRQAVLQQLVAALGASKLDPEVAHKLAGSAPKQGS